jgi:NADPH:quinone reductase-like Zn-dependent oxidoreductase
MSKVDEWLANKQPPKVKTLRRNIFSGECELTDSNWPNPCEGTDQLYLVKVVAVGLTRGEELWQEDGILDRDGYIMPGHDRKGYFIPGCDFAGVVIHAPPDAQHKPGDEVYGRMPTPGPGATRPYVTVEAPHLLSKPKCLSMEEAASVPTPALAAFSAVFGLGIIQLPFKFRAPRPFPQFLYDFHNSKKTLLILGGTTNVGLWAIQLARLSGVGYIGATCAPTPKSMAMVKSFGATEALDYTTMFWDNPNVAQSCSLIIDCVGDDDLLVQVWNSCLHRNGCIINIAAPWRAQEPQPQGVVGKWDELQHYGFLTETRMFF